jgi:hypothetical protein
MISFLKKLWNNKRGNTIAIAAASMPLFIGAAGLATDTIQWTLWKRQLQRAADSAAIAGVYNREANGGATTSTSAAVSHDLTINLHTFYSLKSGYPTVSYPSDSGAKTDQVSVTVAIQQPLSFSSFFLSTAPTITASSTAAAITTGTPCALALNSTGTAMNYSGNATVSAPTCILYSDSASSNSASAGGSSAVTAKAIDAVGGIQQSNNFNVGSYGPYSPSISDPFANVTPDPSQMHCTSSALTNNTDVSSAGLGSTNCFSSLSVGSNKTLTIPSNSPLNGKTIYINGGSVDLKGAFTCTCTIVLTNTSTASNATIGSFSSNAQATNNITAPTTGTFAGIAVYQDRRATGNTDKINGGSNNVIQGAIYFPKDTLWINGTGTATSLCAMWIANNITFLGNSSIAISSPDDSVCSGAGLPSSAAAKVVRLVA